MLSARSAGPYMPDMAIAPRPTSDVMGPAAPSWRFLIGRSYPPRGIRRRATPVGPAAVAVAGEEGAHARARDDGRRGYDGAMAAPLAHVLVRDPDLAGELAGDRLREGERELIAPTGSAFEGLWECEDEGEGARGGAGVLLLEGLIVRR